FFGCCDAGGLANGQPQGYATATNDGKPGQPVMWHEVATREAPLPLDHVSACSGVGQERVSEEKSNRGGAEIAEGDVAGILQR
ncbi:MAG: hypothetical protein WCS43_15270, partial [Verrucomicrobiota bacterium]